MAYRHGFCGRRTSHPTYWVWANMIQRCNNPNHVSWKWYGAKGIKVCERWKDFALFWEDMGEDWEKGLTLDRKENDKDYCPENCRWATTHEQRMNDSHGLTVTVNGETKRLTEWCRIFKIKAPTVRQRIRNRWTILDALSTPVRKTTFL